MIVALSLAVLLEHRLGGSSVISVLQRASIGITISPVEEEMHNRLRVSLFTGRVARWSVSVALCRNILHIRLVVCVGRDAKERGL